MYPPSSSISYHSLNLFVFSIKHHVEARITSKTPKKNNLWSINFYPPKNRGERFEGSLYNIHLTTLQHYILQLFILVDIFLGFFSHTHLATQWRSCREHHLRRSSMVETHLFHYTVHHRKLIWQCKLPGLIGGTSSNGCFSIVILVIRGVYSFKVDWNMFLFIYIPTFLPSVDFKWAISFFGICSYILVFCKRTWGEFEYLWTSCKCWPVFVASPVLRNPGPFFL